MNPMSTVLRLDPILCDGYGHCAELLPEVVDLDDWGYPIVASEPLSAALLPAARRAVSMCPRLALALGEASR